MEKNMKKIITLCLFFITTQVFAGLLMVVMPAEVGIDVSLGAEEQKAKKRAEDTIRKAVMARTSEEWAKEQAENDIATAEEQISQAETEIMAVQVSQLEAEKAIVAAEAAKQKADEKKKEANAEAVMHREIVYPDCKIAIVVQNVHNLCPPGYSPILYLDMVQGVQHDDIRICQKAVNSREGTECFVGYLASGIQTNTNIPKIQSTERVLVPKKMRSRVKFSPVYSGCMRVTIVNETTGEYIYNSFCFTNGQVVELPFSVTMDQSFRFFSADIKQIFPFVGGQDSRGVMMIYIDHITEDKTAMQEAQKKAQKIIEEENSKLNIAEANRIKTLAAKQQAEEAQKKALKDKEAAETWKQERVGDKEAAEKNIMEAEEKQEQAEAIIESIYESCAQEAKDEL